MISVLGPVLYPYVGLLGFLQGIENVYTQHQPLLFQTMENITKGRLKDVDYPFVGNHFQQGRSVGLNHLISENLTVIALLFVLHLLNGFFSSFFLLPVC